MQKAARKETKSRYPDTISQVYARSLIRRYMNRSFVRCSFNRRHRHRHRSIARSLARSLNRSLNRKRGRGLQCKDDAEQCRYAKESRGIEYTRRGSRACARWGRRNGRGGRGGRGTRGRRSGQGTFRVLLHVSNVLAGRLSSGRCGRRRLCCRHREPLVIEGFRRCCIARRNRDQGGEALVIVGSNYLVTSASRCRGQAH